MKKEQLDQFTALYKEGWSYEALAKYFNRSVSQMQNTKSYLKLTKEVNCIDCKRIITVSNTTRQLCPECKEDRRIRYVAMKEIRHHFHRWLTLVPKFAVKKYNEFVKAEDKEFVHFVLGKKIIERIKEVK